MVAELHKSTYVDDLLSGGATEEEASELKAKTIEIFNDATFTLHKWQSNEPQLEERPVMLPKKEKTFAKQQLGESCVWRLWMAGQLCCSVLDPRQWTV